MLIGTATANATTLLKSTFTPEILVLVAADLTKVDSIKCNIYGEGVLIDIDQTGLKYLESQGQVQDDSASYTLPVADGKFNKNACDITVVNSHAANNIDVYGFGSKQGNLFIKHEMKTYLKGNQIKLDKFLYVAIPGTTADDMYTVVWNIKDPETQEIVGTFNEQMSRAEIRAIAGFRQFNNGFVINNYSQQIKEITIYPSTDRTVYISSFVLPTA
jgi:hypothetical protein